MITDISQLDLSKTYSYADYLTWQLDEWVELIKGSIVKMSPAPNTYHQKIEGSLFYLIYHFLKKDKCQVFSSPFDVRLQRKANDEEVFTVVQPDICVICDPSMLDENGCNGAPDMIVEILSPYTSKKDINDKYDLYQEAGVLEYWIVSPLDKIVDVFLLVDHKYQLQKKYSGGQVINVHVLPGLGIDLKEVFV